MLKEYLTNIANAIRSKLGTEDKLNAQDFADKINEVYDKGRTDEWSDFWDDFQENGNRISYEGAFGCYIDAKSYWSDVTFNPKYPIITNSAHRLFKGTKITDLTKKLKECGVYLDVSNAKDINQAFGYSSSILTVPELDIRKATTVTSLFACDFNLHTVDKIILSENNNLTFTEFAYLCHRLKEIRFEGKIPKTINFSWSPLSIESMKSIISCLKNHSGTTNEATQTISFTESCWTNLEESTSPYEDGLTDNKELSWQDYIQTSLGWLVA